MPKQKLVIYATVLAALAVGLLLWHGNLGNVLAPFLTPGASDEAAQQGPSATDKGDSLPAAGSIQGPADQAHAIKKTAIPAPDKSIDSKGEPAELPPAPPLPDIHPEAAQDERQEAYGLEDSVDFIVRPDEPFEIAGKQWTIDEIFKRLHPAIEHERILPSIQEADIGSALRKPIKPQSPARGEPAAYYAVRVVLPEDNLWNIHYAIIQEYLARRDIILSPWADEPYRNGRSSGVGRLLKFIEGLVYVYNLNQNQLKADIHLIYPNEIIVFFKISDLFAALDKLQPEDLQRLRYVRNSLQLEHSGQSSKLLER